MFFVISSLKLQLNIKPLLVNIKLSLNKFFDTWTYFFKGLIFDLKKLYI